MVEYSKINCKLTNVQVNKLKRAVKSNEGTTLRFNNLTTDIKLSKSQIKKLIQSGGFLGKLLSKLAGSLMKVAMPLALGEGSGSKKKLNSLLPFHPLTNIKINEYYANEPRFNGVYSRDNLPKIILKGAYVINLYEYENTGTHWIGLFVKTNEAIYFDSFGIEYFFLKKLINLLVIIILKVTYLEYKHTIQLCVDIFV